MELYWDYEIRIPEITVYDIEPSKINTGIIDASGNEIIRYTKGMDPIGFIRFPIKDKG